MSRKKLLKLGISILALNALGVATYHVAPDLYQIPTVHAEETPAEDEEIPDGAERNIALKFKRMLDDVEAFIADYKANPNDEDNKTGLEDSLAEATNYLPTAKKAMKSPEGQKGFVAYEARYNELKAKVEALLAGKTEQPAEPKVEHQEITTTEEIPYASRTENNADLAEGTRNVKQAGVKGTKTITWDITLTDGKETARTKKSEKVTKEPVEEIIEVGTKKTGVETKETVTVEEKVAFKEETKVDPALDKGQTRVEEGEEGIDEVTYEVTKVDGVEKSRKEVSRKTKKAAKNKITYTGSKAVVTTKEVTKTEEVAFRTREVENALLAEGVRRVKTAGQKGVRTIVETVTYTDGKETGREVKSNTITTPAVDEVVEVGTKKAAVVTTKEETKTEEVAFQTKEVTNPDLPEGSRQVKTAGKKGVRTIVETVTYTDGKETGREVKSNTITTPAVDEVVEVGTKKVVAPVVTTKEETKTEDVAFQVKEVKNADLPEGSRQVKAAGKKGVRTIVYTVTYTDGVETGREVKSNTITTPAVDEIVEVGTKKVVAPVVTTKEETKTEEVAFQVKEVQNADLPEGSRQVKTAGKKGVRTIVYTVTYTDGVETGRVEKSNTITTPAVDEVVEVGTKKVASTTTNGDKKDTATTGNQAENTKKEETVSQDQKALPSTGTASTSLLSMIGLFIAGLVGFVVRKKD
ncbi:G5 domain-containing protein [Streptococcus sp. oral taxon 064]|nr:G5 domain-containing protein [Streptococcus sp. oral taxon 064]ANR75669.1 cell surface protein [Streptococcus sp. oral taxon 064]